MTDKTATLVRLTGAQRARIDERTIGYSLAEFVRQAVDHYLAAFDQRAAAEVDALRLRLERRHKRPRKLDRRPCSHRTR